jgi:hypothetical protein
MHDLIDWIRQIRWSFWIIVIALLGMWLARIWKRHADQRKARAAEHWPTAEGMVQTINVIEPTPQAANIGMGYNATFIYSYSVQQGGEIEYYSGKHSRMFTDEGAAWDWLRALKDKRIRIHVQPGRPSVSAVLPADLDHLIVFTSASGAAGALVLPGIAPRLSPELRGATEIAAWLTAAGFCLSLADHLSRLFAGKPLYPQLSLVLWIGILVGGIPFALWYQSKGGETLFGKPKNWARVPQWLRISIYILNLYVGFFWLINMAFSSGAAHGPSHIHRLDPMFSGAFLALLYGDAAAILYAQLESSEDPYNLSASGLQPK